MNKLAILFLALTVSSSIYAQSEDEGELVLEGEEAREAEVAPPSPVTPTSKPPRAVRGSGQSPSAIKLAEDYVKPGWNATKLQHGIGFNSNFLGTGNGLIYEMGLSRPRSWTFFLGYSKSSDSYQESSTSSNSGTGTVTSIGTTSYTGTKNPHNLSLGAAYNWRLYRNHFFQARVGIFSALDYYTKTSYGTGNASNTVVSSTPGTTTVQENSRGTVTVEKAPNLRLGPVFDTYVFLRWFPNLSVGMQGGILYVTNSQTKTRTRTTTQTYTIVSGVQQSPTAYATSDQTLNQNTGGNGSTFAVAGSNFNVMGNFVIRYAW